LKTYLLKQQKYLYEYTGLENEIGQSLRVSVDFGHISICHNDDNCQISLHEAIKLRNVFKCNTTSLNHIIECFTV